jgi:hypothetical protein
MICTCKIARVCCTWFARANLHGQEFARAILPVMPVVQSMLLSHRGAILNRKCNTNPTCQEGSEFETLGLLWNYCRDSPHAENDTVVYIHNKGSFHPSKENTMFRRFITPGALSRECSEMPPECNICSFRFSPLPHPHSPGNMWAARCNYIKLLLDPIKFEWEMERFIISVRWKNIRLQLGQVGMRPSIGCILTLL